MGLAGSETAAEIFGNSVVLLSLENLDFAGGICSFGGLLKTAGNLAAPLTKATIRVV